MPITPTHNLSPRACLFVASLALAVTAPFAQAVAQTAQPTAFAQPADGNQRINLSGRLRMLSQRISGMACNHAAGIEPELSYQNLEAAVAEYTTILNGLENGDPALNIFGPEKSRRVLSSVQDVRDTWDGFSTFADAVLAGDTGEPTIEALAVQSSELLSEAQKLVLRVVDQHQDRVKTIQRVAFTIDIAGRQRMLAQKISKNICLIHEQDNTDAAMADLTTAYQIFDASLVALQLGMPEVGVSPPPNGTVEEGLKVVAADWLQLKPLIEQAIAGEQFDDATRVQLFHDLNTLTGKMNAAVQMYVAASQEQQT